MIIRLRDNRFGMNGLFFKREERDGGVAYVFDCQEGAASGARSELSSDDKDILKKFGGRDLLELVSKGAVTDAACSHLGGNDRAGLSFFEYVEKEDGFRLDTGNIMGVLKFRDPEKGASVQVEVLSRFDNGGNNYFLNYLLSRAFDVALGAEAVTAEHPSVLDLLLDVIFVRRLDDASRGGLFRQYRTFRNNDWSFKGRLDLPRHLFGRRGNHERRAFCVLWRDEWRHSKPWWQS